MREHARRLGLGLLAIVALTACGATQGLSKADRLKESVYLYNRAIRWRNLEAAAQHVEPTQRAAFLNERRGDQTIVMGAEVLTVEPDYDNGVAEVVVGYEWRDPSDISVRATRVRQLWKLVDDVWYLASRQEVKAKPDEKRAPESRF